MHQPFVPRTPNFCISAEDTSLKLVLVEDVSLHKSNVYSPTHLHPRAQETDRYAAVNTAEDQESTAAVPILVMVLREPTRKDALLDLLIVNREGLVDEVAVEGYLHGLIDHNVFQFKILGIRGKLSPKF